MGTLPKISVAAPAEPTFEKEAALLANSYPELLKQRDWLKQRIDGDWTYTKETAIDELTNITVAYDSERVQSSNISRSTERVALMITDEYLARRQREYNQQREELVEQLKYIEWKINVVERVMRERMSLEQRIVYQNLVIGNGTYEATRKKLRKKRPKKFINRDISSLKDGIPSCFAEELSFLFKKGDCGDALSTLAREAEENTDES